MREVFDKTLSALAVLATLVAITIAARTRLPALADREIDDGNVSFVAGWQSFMTLEDREWPSAPPLRVVVFSDYFCSHCRNFARAVTRLEHDFPGRMTVQWRHYPVLSTESMGAALAVECAAKAGRRSEMHRSLVMVDELPGRGMLWPAAVAAGVSDSAAFVACLVDDSILAVIRRDMEDARRLGIVGTPLILLDSLKLNGAPSEEYMRKYLSRMRD